MKGVRWHCGYFVGPCKWQNLDDYEPDECNTEFETEFEDDNDVDLWNHGMYSTYCPSCGNELTQKWDNPELIK